MPVPVQDKISANELAELLEIRSPDDFWDDVTRGESSYSYVYDAALREGMTEEEAEEAAQKAEQEELDEAMEKYWSGLEDAAETLFGHHALDVDRVMKRGEWTGQYKISPRATWKDAAAEIMGTINGVGTFYYSSVKEFLDSGPYTPRQAVLTHLHWIKQYPDVYGTKSAGRIFESALR